MSAAAASLSYGGPASVSVQTKKQPQQLQQPNSSNFIISKERRNTGVMMSWRGKYGKKSKREVGEVKCNAIGIGDFIGGDLVRFDLGKWLSDVEEHKALAIYPPHEGGYEGRYLSRLTRQGYYFLDLTARGLGDPETTLTKVHPVCPVSLFIVLKDKKNFTFTFLNSQLNLYSYCVVSKCRWNCLLYINF